MRPLEFYEIVEVLDNETTRQKGLAGQRGIVIGLAPHLLGIEDDPPPGEPEDELYGIYFEEEARSLRRRDLAPTGEKVKREAVYDGTSIRVPAQDYRQDREEQSPGSDDATTP